MWKALPLHEREYWDNRASEDKERYLREKEAYTGPWQVPYTRPKKVRHTFKPIIIVLIIILS